MNKLFYIGLHFLIIIQLINLGCNRHSPNRDDLVLIPQDSNIPYANHNVISIDKKNESKGFSNISGVKFLEKYLDNPESITNKNKIPIHTSDSDDLLITSIKDRVLILDADENILWEYSVRKKIVKKVASYGRGPGGLSSTTDMLIRNSNLYISMSAARISKFNCRTFPCKFKEELKMKDMIIYSFAKKDNSFAILGSSPVTQRTEEKLSDKPIHIYNPKGKRIKDFGKMYDTNKQWMLRRPFLQGKIEYEKNIDNYVLTYQRFPYIYVYDNDLKITMIFKINDFLVGKQKFWPKKGRLQIVMEDHSIIKNIKSLGRGIILVTVETLKNQRVEDNIFVWDKYYNFYVINLKRKKYKSLGSNNGSIIKYLESGLLEINDNSIYYYQNFRH